MATLREYFRKQSLPCTSNKVELPDVVTYMGTEARVSVEAGICEAVDKSESDSEVWMTPLLILTDSRVYIS